MKKELNPIKASYVKDIYLDNVLNFEDKLISFTDQDQKFLKPVHIIYGKNGIGKTNFLKLISYFKDMLVTPLATITSKIKPLVKDLNKNVYLAINLNEPNSKDTYLYYIKLNYQKGTFKEVIELKTNDFHQIVFENTGTNSDLKHLRQNYKQIYNAEYLINNIFKHNSKQPPLAQSRQNSTVKKVKTILQKIVYIDSIYDLENYLRDHINNELDGSKRKINIFQNYLAKVLIATFNKIEDYELNIKDIRFNPNLLTLNNFGLEVMETHCELYTSLSGRTISNGIKNIILLTFILELQKFMNIQILYNDIDEGINQDLMKHLIKNDIEHSSGLIASTNSLLLSSERFVSFNIRR